jgi:hypothetical protein
VRGEGRGIRTGDVTEEMMGKGTGVRSQALAGGGGSPVGAPYTMSVVPSPPPASSSAWSDSTRTQESGSCHLTPTSAGPSPWSTVGPP